MGVFSCKFTAYFQNTFLKNTCGGLLLQYIDPFCTNAIFRNLANVQKVLNIQQGSYVNFKFFTMIC